MFCSRLTSFSFYKKFEDEINEAAAPRFAGATGGGSGTEPSLPKGAERTPALQGRTGKAAYSSGSPDHSACEETAPSASCPAPSLSFRDWLEGGHPRLAALHLDLVPAENLISWKAVGLPVCKLIVMTSAAPDTVHWCPWRLFKKLIHDLPSFFFFLLTLHASPILFAAYPLAS